MTWRKHFILQSRLFGGFHAFFSKQLIEQFRLIDLCHDCDSISLFSPLKARVIFNFSMHPKVPELAHLYPKSDGSQGNTPSGGNTQGAVRSGSGGAIRSGSGGNGGTVRSGSGGANLPSRSPSLGTPNSQSGAQGNGRFTGRQISQSRSYQDSERSRWNTGGGGKGIKRSKSMQFNKPSWDQRNPVNEPQGSEEGESYDPDTGRVYGG